ncbi:hypothetical protein TorRG33x02_317250 [Trema orientale]|uniref:Uncharacterized protein n=1 Tax=Trema orientale TaxID=63057 RepID=A0A2P5BL33_TREOI|nr:hypothetical protein TorRG33x02_317250 [Trema orientale]
MTRHFTSIQYHGVQETTAHPLVGQAFLSNAQVNFSFHWKIQ